MVSSIGINRVERNTGKRMQPDSETSRKGNAEPKQMYAHLSWKKNRRLIQSE